MDKKTNTLKPPYGSFKTARSFIERLKNTVLPEYIDRGMMKGMSGDAQTETLSAFRFLQLLGEKDKAEPALQELVDAFGTKQWASTLASVITKAYAPIIGDLNLKTASARMLSDKFKEHGVDGFMQARSIRFYVAALKDAEFEVSPHFRAPTPPKKPKAPKAPKIETKDDGKSGGKNETNAPEIEDGYMALPLPPNDRKFIFPKDITEADVKLITTVLPAYVVRGSKK